MLSGLEGFRPERLVSVYWMVGHKQLATRVSESSVESTSHTGRFFFRRFFSCHFFYLFLAKIFVFYNITPARWWCFGSLAPFPQPQSASVVVDASDSFPPLPPPLLNLTSVFVTSFFFFSLSPPPFATSPPISAVFLLLPHPFLF